MRVGQGYDVHKLAEDRKLILCGEEIPHSVGLLGHSDADVALHALMDALLGAAALGDIGHLFPDNDDKYKGISSVILLKDVMKRIEDKGFTVSNMDITIIAQKPKISPFIEKMRENISKATGVLKDRINVKATTTEKLGFEGRCEGISSLAVVLLEEK